jgi:hypothetical protein
MGKGITFVGLDAHKETISVAMPLPGSSVPGHPRAIVWLSPDNSREVT